MYVRQRAEGRTDPRLPFFTAHGSFWTNSTAALLASASEAGRQACPRNRCSGEGYESVASIPLRYAGRTLGLVQLNDPRSGRFTPEKIAFLERAAGPASRSPWSNGALRPPCAPAKPATG